MAAAKKTGAIFSERQGNMTIKREKKKNFILIVDDNEALLDALEVLLSENFDVIPAADACQALQILSTVEPAIIFLDCFMPGFNGIQLFREIRQMGLSSRVVIITAAHRELFEDEISLLGADGVLSKPFDVGEIEELALEACSCVH